MRIGMIAPISHPYPPSGYGPWERVTHDLTERLVAMGHDVTLFSTAESITTANLVSTADRPLMALPDHLRHRTEADHIRTALAHADDAHMDVLHSHLHVHVLARLGRTETPIVSTLHGSAWNPDHHETLRRHARRPFVSLSDKEREFVPELNYVATIPNGIRLDEFPTGEGAGDYLAFVGRLAPEKAPHLAIETAKRSGNRLLIAGVIDETHADYAKWVLGQTGAGVDYVGALDRPELSMLLRDARGLLMPLLWDEPFGLVVVEALASGTPVVAWRRGAMPEIIDDADTGLLVDGVDEAVEAVERVSSLDRSVCAATARSRFSDEAMAAAYLDVYGRVQDIASSSSATGVTAQRMPTSE